MNSQPSSTKALQSKRIAIVHNSLWSMRGAERVLLSFCKAFPNGEIFSLFGDLSKIPDEIKSHKIHFSFLQKIPLIKKLNRLTLPLWPIAVERWDFTQFDIVVSLSSSVTKGVVTSPDTFHLSYIFTPMRFLWDLEDQYLSNMIWFIRLPFKMFSHLLRVWDVISSSRPDYNIAISQLVKGRLQKYHGINADRVIYPPTELRFPDNAINREEWFLSISPFKENKGGEEILELGKSLPIKITGSDPKHTPGSRVQSLGWVTEKEKWDLYRKTKALLYLGVEDFGMVPLEALSVGCPVIALEGSGFLELFPVQEGKFNGIVRVSEANEASIRDAIVKVESIDHEIILSESVRKALSEQEFMQQISEALVQGVRFGSDPV